MKNIIYPLRQLFADPRNTSQVLHAGPRYFLQTAELLQQSLTPLGSQTFDPFQYRGIARLRPPLPMAGDGKPVGFIAYLLDKV